MKKRIVFALLFPFTMVFLFLISTSHTTDEEIKVGFIIDNFDIDRWYKNADFFIEGEVWQKDIDFFAERVDELGGIALIRVARGSVEKQFEYAVELIELGVQTLVIVPVHPDSAVNIVEYAHSKNVKVVAYDRMINNSDVDYFVAYDTKEAGKSQIDNALKRSHKGNYMFISGPKEDLNYSLYREGIFETLNKNIQNDKVNLILDTALTMATSMEAYLVMEDFISRSDVPIDVILTANDAVASGVILALENHDRLGKVFVAGQNADLSGCRNIALDKQAMTVYKPIEALSYAAALTAIKLAKNEQIVDPLKNMSTRMTWATQNSSVTLRIFNGKSKVNSLLITPIVVSQKNLLETVVSDGHLSEEDIYDK